MRGGRQAACRHGPARHFSLNTLFFISFQPTNLASTPPPSLILDTTHITKVTLRESPRVTPTQPPLQTRCFPTRENCSSSSSSGNLLSSCAGRRPSTGSTWARWGSAAAIRQLRHDNNWWLSSILAHHLFWVWKKMNVNNSKTDNTFLKISTNSRSDQIQRLEITSDIWCIQSSVFHSFSLSVLSLQIGYTLLHTHRQCTKRHYLKDSFTTFLKHSLFIWFQACKDLQKYCTEHQNEDFLIKGFASQKQNPFREKSSCAVLWEHYNFNVFVLYIYL